MVSFQSLVRELQACRSDFARSVALEGLGTPLQALEDAHSCKYYVYVLVPNDKKRHRKMYIGVTKNPRKRASEHRSRARTNSDMNTSKNMYFYNRGIEMRIISCSNSKKEAETMEATLIELLGGRNSKYLLNRNNGGGGDGGGIRRVSSKQISPEKAFLIGALLRSELYTIKEISQLVGCTIHQVDGISSGNTHSDKIPFIVPPTGVNRGVFLINGKLYSREAIVKRIYGDIDSGSNDSKALGKSLRRKVDTKLGYYTRHAALMYEYFDTKIEDILHFKSLAAYRAYKGLTPTKVIIDVCDDLDVRDGMEMTQIFIADLINELKVKDIL